MSRSDRLEPIAAPEKVVVIANPKSGRRRGRQLMHTLQGSKWSDRVVDVFVTDPQTKMPTHEAVARARDRGADRIVMVGGDGTLMRTLTAILDSGDPIPVAIVPAGTGNIVANDLGIPRRLEEALHLAFCEAAVHWWDVGRIVSSGNYFVLRASAGHDANTLAAMNKPSKRFMNTLAYAIPAALQYLQMDPVRFTLKIDDEPAFGLEGITAFVAVSSRITSSFDSRLAPHMYPDDGMLYAGVIHPQQILQNIPVLLQQMALKGKNMLSLYPVHRQVRIDAHPPQRTQVDGEELGSTPLDIEVIERSGPFVVPPTDLGTL